MIELTNSNESSVMELYNNVYHETSPADRDRLERLLSLVCSELDSIEGQVLVLRYGLDGNSKKSLDEVAADFGISEERVRQIEAKAFKKLLHPVRRNYVFGIVNEPKTKTYSFSLSSELTKTNLSVRTIACLKRAGVTTVKELLNVNLEDLKNVKNLGKKSFEEIVAFIKENKVKILNK